jgi:glycosyltransferase involved in cell wall biosynthesis
MKQFRFHLLGLPNAPVNLDYSLDGFAAAGFRFAQMMQSLGHYVILYGAEGSNAPCNEFVQIISERERCTLLESAPVNNCKYQHVSMNADRPLWQRSNACAAAEVALRKKPKDFLLTIGGLSQKLVFDFNPDLIDVEYSIGYEGNFCNHRVFESYAWMHTCYGRQGIADGRFYDAVIPMFFDPEQFTFREKPEDYLLYVGRLIERKGVHVACQVATEAGKKLKVIGHGEGKELETLVKSITSSGHEYLGPLGWQERNEIMSKALAVLTPTLYLEPFNCVAVEAQLCGTPVISTNWGGFTETIKYGETGFRCSYLGEFVRAVKMAGEVDRDYIRRRAIKKFSMWTLRFDYQLYFERLMTRWEKGWDTLD